MTQQPHHSSEHKGHSAPTAGEASGTKIGVVGAIIAGVLVVAGGTAVYLNPGNKTVPVSGPAPPTVKEEIDKPPDKASPEPEPIKPPVEPENKDKTDKNGKPKPPPPDPG